jgi:hypothetical protein
MKLTTRLVGAFIMLITLCSSTLGVQAQPSTEPAVPSRSRLTLTPEQEYTIREIIKDVKVAKEKSATETVGDSVPENVKLYPLPTEIEQKIPQAQSHEFLSKTMTRLYLSVQAIDVLLMY